MNVYQLVRKARFEVDALRTNNVKSDLWQDEECIDALNTAMDRAARIIRLSGSDLLTKTVKSTDSAVDLISETYDPSVLTITVGVTDYELPPDCIRPISIAPIDGDFSGVRFHPAVSSQATWLDQRTTPDDDLATVRNADADFYYTLLGERTLRVSPTPQDEFDIELVYQSRAPRLFVYTGGTLRLTQNSATVTGLGTYWNEYMRTPAELIIGDPDDVVLTRVYPRVDSIDGDTSLTLKKAYTGVDVDGQEYALAMVPTLPEEHHTWLAQMTAAIMLRKVSIELSDAAAKALEGQLEAEVKPEVTIRQAHESLTTEPYRVP